MHWNTVSKQCRCWAIIASFSGMKEKLRRTFEAATAPCCFSARPSSSRLNKPSSSAHHSEERGLVTLFADASTREEPDPKLPCEHYSMIRFHINKNIIFINVYVSTSRGISKKNKKLELTQNVGDFH